MRLSEVKLVIISGWRHPIKPAENTLIEYYTLAFGPEIAMFVKRSVKPALVETYEEAKKVEAEMESIDKYLAQPEEKILETESLCCYLSRRMSGHMN